ncbi:MAG TPA: cation:dicarboxylase symporter family transporter, partial [Steroidobacteraceae bacterium]|nr:cation:dicarboxylase symporter family transporter [Steroidobacteraceae bacterium]
MSLVARKLANRILLGLVIGAAAGALTLVIGAWVPAFLEGARTASTWVFDPLGQVFLRMLFFVIVPLVFSSLASGVLQLGRLSRLGPLAGRTFGLFALNMAIAVALGLVMMNILEPGGQLDESTTARLMEEYSGAAKGKILSRAQTPEVTPSSLVEMFMPRNLFGAFVGSDRNLLGEMLPLILFAILVG